MKRSVFFMMVMLCTALQAQPNFGKARISIPGVTGVLELDPGLTPWQVRVRPDGKEVQLEAMQRPDHLGITAFLQKVNFSATPERCRAEWWRETEKVDKKYHIRTEKMTQTVVGGIARVEYIIPEFREVKVPQKGVHAYLGSRDLCAEIHLTKQAFVAEDQKLIEQVLDTAKLLPDETMLGGAQNNEQQKYQYIAEGSRFYLQRNYSAAAERYQKALDLEKQNRTLSRSFFRPLIDNLGMSYGIGGNLPRAMETFQYGIAQDPEYPLFYYNMACTYGEMGKMDEALTQLSLAYKYKANMIPGEKFPDPLRDESFRSFVKDRKFVDAVHTMQGR
jgi:tetratricopeptide (TPR) repeat protein